MNSKLRLLTAAAVSLLWAGAALGDEPSSPPVSPSAAADSGPNTAAAPTEAHVWMTGHWVSENGQWKWIAAHWELPPSRSAVWVAGHWVSQNGAWVWMNGAWTVGDNAQTAAGQAQPYGGGTLYQGNTVAVPSTAAPYVDGQYAPGTAVATTDYGPIDYDAAYPYYWDAYPWYWGFPGAYVGFGWGGYWGGHYYGRGWGGGHWGGGHGGGGRVGGGHFGGGHFR